VIPKIWLINAVLLGLFLFLGAKSYEVWSDGYDLPTAEISKKGDQVRYAGKTAKNRIQLRGVYEDLAAENLFSPERSEYIPEGTVPGQDEAQPEALASEDHKVKIFLYGVVIMEGYKAALVSNPASKKGGTKNLTVKENDLVGDFKVASILKDRIFIEKSNKRYEISLFDEKKPARKIIIGKKKGKTGKKPTIVSAANKEKAKPDRKLQKDKSKSRSSIMSSAFPGSKKLKKGKTNAGGPAADDLEGKGKVLNTPFGKVKQSD